MQQALQAINPSQNLMSSKSLLEIINIERQNNLENSIRANDFIARIEDELTGDYYETFVVQNTNNTTSKIFNLTQDQCLLISMRESKAVRRAVLLKLKDTQKPLTHVESLRLLADTIERNEIIQSQLLIAQPKAEALDLMTFCEGLLGVREAAKVLKMKQNELVTLLINRDWLYRDGHNTLQAYSKRLEQDYVKHVMTVPIQSKDGSDRVYQQPKITAKGMVRLAQIVGRGVKK
jgi:phage antirepressor YoqD-like protein